MSAKLLLAVAFAGLALPAAAQGTRPTDPYVLCSFYPAPGVCEEVYRRAATDKTSPVAESVRAEYQSYVRYLGTAARALSQEDVAWLTTNAVTLPDTLTPEQVGGLHALLADPDLQKDARQKYLAVNGYLRRAVQAHLYCVFNECPGSQSFAST